MTSNPPTRGMGVVTSTASFRTPCVPNAAWNSCPTQSVRSTPTCRPASAPACAFVRGFDRPARLSQPPYASPSGLSGPRATGQNVHGLVVCLQVAYREQPPRRVARLQLTPGNVDDRRLVPKLAERLWGCLFGDKGYRSQPLTRDLLRTRQLRLVTHLKRNMANRLLLLHDNVMLRRRALVETVFDQLQHVMQMEHTRHRSPTNFAVNGLGGLIACCHQPTKLSIYRNG